MRCSSARLSNICAWSFPLITRYVCRGQNWPIMASRMLVAVPMAVASVYNCDRHVSLEARMAFVGLLCVANDIISLQETSSGYESEIMSLRLRIDNNHRQTGQYCMVLNQTEAVQPSGGNGQISFQNTTMAAIPQSCMFRWAAWLSNAFLAFHIAEALG